ncbi:MAG: VOC family protein [Planctomycetes bacterium]|nr:VOC family protein [Planctomycetota bacterium]
MAVGQLGFDHLAISVSNIERSAYFYGEVLGLQPIQRPDFKFPGLWYTFGAGCDLHIIGGREDRATKDHHFSMRIDDIDLALRELDKHGVEYRKPALRPDGVQQIFFEDPDGNLIELDYFGKK